MTQLASQKPKAQQGDRGLAGCTGLDLNLWRLCTALYGLECVPACTHKRPCKNRKYFQSLICPKRGWIQELGCAENFHYCGAICMPCHRDMHVNIKTKNMLVLINSPTLQIISDTENVFFIVPFFRNFTKCFAVNQRKIATVIKLHKKPEQKYLHLIFLN